MHRFHARVTVRLLTGLTVAMLGLATVVLAGVAAHADASPRFVDPISVAVSRQGSVYVFDRGTWSIDRLSSQGRLVRSWRVDIAHTFPGPGKLTVDGAGNIYVVLGNLRRGRVYVGGIAKFSPSGKLLARLSSATLLNAQSLAARTDGTLFVLVPGQTQEGNPSGRVVTLSPGGIAAGNRPLSTAGHDFLAPDGMAIDAHGSLYVSGVVGSCSRGCQGGEADVIERLAVGGAKHLRIWKYGWGQVAGGPGGLAVDSRGAVYAGPGSRIVKISSAGKVIARWGGAVGCGPLRFRSIADLGLDGRSDLYVVDEVNKNLQKIATNGQPLAIVGGCPSSTPPTPILPTPTPAQMP